jgi:hypothetical protein
LHRKKRINKQFSIFRRHSPSCGGEKVILLAFTRLSGKLSSKYWATIPFEHKITELFCCLIKDIEVLFAISKPRLFQTEWEVLLNRPA